MMGHKHAVEMRLIGPPDDIEKMVERVAQFFTILDAGRYPQPARKQPGMVIKYLTVVNPGDAHGEGGQ